MSGFKRDQTSGKAKSGGEEQTQEHEIVEGIDDNEDPILHFQQNSRNSYTYQDHQRDNEYRESQSTEHPTSHIGEVYHYPSSHSSHQPHVSNDMYHAHHPHPTNSIDEQHQLSSQHMPGHYPYSFPSYYPVYYYYYPPPGYPPPPYSQHPLPHHPYPHLYPLPPAQEMADHGTEHMNSEGSIANHPYHDHGFSHSRMEEQQQTSQRSAIPTTGPNDTDSPPPPSIDPFPFSPYQPNLSNYGENHPSAFYPQRRDTINSSATTSITQEQYKERWMSRKDTVTKSNDDTGKNRAKVAKSAKEYEEEEEQRRLQRNLMIKKKEREIKERMNLISKKKDETKTEDEVKAYVLFEQRRQRKNERSRERTKENRQEMERILGIPDGSRTEEERKWLNRFLKAKHRKNDNDRSRRKRIKLGQASSKSSISSTQSKDLSTTYTGGDHKRTNSLPVPESIKMTSTARTTTNPDSNDNNKSRPTCTTLTTTSRPTSTGSGLTTRNTEQETESIQPFSWSSIQTSSDRPTRSHYYINNNPQQQQQQQPDARTSAPSYDDNNTSTVQQCDDDARNVNTIATSNRPHTPSNILDVLVDFMEASPADSLARVLAPSPLSVGRSQRSEGSTTEQDDINRRRKAN